MLACMAEHRQTVTDAIYCKQKYRVILSSDRYLGSFPAALPISTSRSEGVLVGSTKVKITHCVNWEVSSQAFNFLRNQHYTGC